MSIEQLEAKLKEAEILYSEMNDGYVKDMYSFLIENLKISINNCKKLNKINGGI